MSRVLLGVMKQSLRFTIVANKAIDRMSRFCGGVASTVLKVEEYGQLTNQGYQLSGPNQRTTLYAWEEQWFKEALPPAPAKILIGGAGWGREAFSLADWSYQVIAFDAVPTLVASGKRLSINKTKVSFNCGRYEDLIEPRSPAAEAFSRAISAQGPFDAVVLGWGSFCHVPGQQMRSMILQHMQTLCPLGPLLISFWARSEDWLPPHGVAWELGAKLGRWLGATNAGSRGGSDQRGDQLSLLGYSHSFSREELYDLASSAGYQVCYTDLSLTSDSFPRATLWPLPTEAK